MKKLTILMLPIFTCVLSCTSAETKMTTLLQNYTVTTVIPKAYFLPARQKGRVQLIEYVTRDYTQTSRPAITKKAYVYLPYGYNADDTKVRYNTLFYMHGWTGIAGELFTVGNGFIKNMFDVMIEKGIFSRSSLLLQHLIMIMPHRIFHAVLMNWGYFIMISGMPCCRLSILILIPMQYGIAGHSAVFHWELLPRGTNFVTITILSSIFFH